MKTVTMTVEFYAAVPEDTDTDRLCLGLSSPVDVVTDDGQVVANTFEWRTVAVKETSSEKSKTR